MPPLHFTERDHLRYVLVDVGHWSKWYRTCDPGEAIEIFFPFAAEIIVGAKYVPATCDKSAAMILTHICRRLNVSPLVLLNGTAGREERAAVAHVAAEPGISMGL
jgi:hypothetical protein